VSAHDAYLKLGELDAKLAEVQANIRREARPALLRPLLAREAALLEERAAWADIYTFESARELAGRMPIEPAIPRRSIGPAFGAHIERKAMTFQSNRKAN
jgi:hypothetical protein